MARTKPDPISILFIGNSYTSFNHLPKMLARLSAAGDVPDVRTGQVTPGGCTLSRHWRKTGARSAIRDDKWDYVVLQEHSVGGIYDAPQMHKYAARFDERIRAAGAKTVFYLTWARQYAPELQPRLTKAYTDIARTCKALVAPVGEAWKLAFKRRKGLALHIADASHPNPAGSYLAACVFYATIHRKPPVGLPGRLTFTNEKGVRRALINLPKPDAAFFQRIARETVQKFAKR